MRERAQAASRAIEQTAPDCVFLDIQMPEMDGFELARTLRRSACRRSCSSPRTTSTRCARSKSTRSTTC